MARRIIVYRQANLAGWRAVLAVFIVISLFYPVIVAFFAILSFIAFALVMALIGAGVYRLISGVWPIKLKLDRH